MDGTTWSLIVAVFAASFVEFVEAFTVVLAMGLTRGWRSALTGAAAAIVALVGFAIAAGYAIETWVPEQLLQLVIGTLLLVFGLQWLRKAVLRSSGLKSIRDEKEEFAQQTAAAAAITGERGRFGLDSFGLIVSFKGVFLEGVEIVFIVITFGLNADNVPVAAAGAGAAGVVVIVAGLLLRSPLSRVPENTLKYGVGVLLATFGTFWAVEGLGYFTSEGESLEFPFGDVALLLILVAWVVVARVLVITLPRLSRAPLGDESIPATGAKPLRFLRAGRIRRSPSGRAAAARAKPLRFLRGFFDFWYQLIIGDDWRIAAAVGIALGLGALFAANGIVAGTALAVLAGLAIVGGFVANLISAVRRRQS